MGRGSRIKVKLFIYQIHDFFNPLPAGALPVDAFPDPGRLQRLFFPPPGRPGGKICI